MAPKASIAAATDDSAGHWLESALREHERPLTLYAKRILGDLDRARDVVQETFLKLCNQRREDVETRLREWLFTVCRNQAYDVRRKEHRMTSLGDEQAALRTSTVERPGDALEQRDEVSHVIASLTALPDKQAEVLRLKFQHGLSYRSISEVTGESIGNVGWLIHVGLKALRAKLGTEAARGAEA